MGIFDKAANKISKREAKSFMDNLRMIAIMQDCYLCRDSKNLYELKSEGIVKDLFTKAYMQDIKLINWCL